MGSGQSSSEQRPISSVSEAAERLRAIVEAAERAASQVIDEAEQDARRIVEDARARADAMAAERLRELAEELGSGAAAGPEPRAPRLRPVDAGGDSAGGHGEEGHGGDAGRPGGSAGPRLLATQMAVSGAGREEIEARLRSAFEIEDPREILDAILGPEG